MLVQAQRLLATPEARTRQLAKRTPGLSFRSRHGHALPEREPNDGVRPI
jgi:hypothetical protein